MMSSQFVADIKTDEFQIIKEILPSVDDAIIVHILRGNNFDLQRSVDAALALAVSLSEEKGVAIISHASNGQNYCCNASNSAIQPTKVVTVSDVGIEERKDGEFLGVAATAVSPSSVSGRSEGLSFWRGTFSSLSNAATVVGSLFSTSPTSESCRSIADSTCYDSQSYRGKYIKLPLIFLKPPSYRFIIDKKDESIMDYTVVYRREQKLLGITIQEYRGEVVIVNLLSKGPSDPHLALESGVRAGDVLTGIDNEMFSPVAEVADVLQVLQLRGKYITLNFRRRLKAEKFDWRNYHVAVKLFTDHQVIEVDEVQLVNIHLRYLKGRILRWNTHELSLRVIEWNLLSYHERRFAGSSFVSNSVGSQIFDPFANLFGIGHAQHHGDSVDGFEQTPNCLSHGRRKSINSFPVYVSVDHSTNAKALEASFSITNDATNLSSSAAGSMRPQHRRKSTGSIPSQIPSAKLRRGSQALVNGHGETAAATEVNLKCEPSASSDNEKSDSLKSLDVPAVLDSVDESDSSQLNEPMVDSTQDIKTKEENDTLRNRRICKSTLRPALSVRVLRAEYFSELEAVVYVIWVLDVLTGVEWIVTRRFREFYELREQLALIRPSMDQIGFPPRMVAADAFHIVEERILVLQRFLRRTCGIICINTTHPSTIQMQLVLQSFLRVEDRVPLLLREEQAAAVADDDETDADSHVANTLQCFVHSVLQMPCMDKVVAGYIDSFMLIECKADPSDEWQESHGMVLVNNMQLFIENLQNVLFDGFRDDCCEMLSCFRVQRKQKQQKMKQQQQKRKHAISSLTQDTGEVEGQSRDNSITSTERVRDCTTKEAHAAAPPAKLQLTSSQRLQQERRRSLLADDAMNKVIRSVIRRQIEVEIFVGCSGRLRHVLRKCYAASERMLLRKISYIADEPQSFYGIPEKHQSPSNWDSVMYAMSNISTKTLPHDMIDALVMVGKQIPLLFQQEHPELGEETYFSADDVLPIFIYTLVRAQIPDLLALNLQLQCLCDAEERLSEHGYYLATLEASLQHLLQADVKNGSEAFLANLSARLKST